MNLGFFMHTLWFIYVRYGMLRYVTLNVVTMALTPFLLHLPEDLCSSETG